MKKNQNLTKKATALLGAIAATSFLGLPVLAEMNSGSVGNTSKQTPNMAGSEQQLQCAPNSTQSNAPATTATPDASDPGAAQLPNQSDPRAGVSPSEQTVTDRVSSTERNSNTQSSNTSSQTTGSQASDRTNSSTYGNVLAQGGATAGGVASEQTAVAADRDGSMSGMNKTSDRYGSSQMSGNRDAGMYGNALAQRGATAGGFARLQLNAASSDRNATRSNSTPYNSNRASATTNNAAAATNGNNSLRSNGVSQSSSQSGQTPGNELAQCSPGMTAPGTAAPRSSVPELRQAPNRSMPSQVPSQQSDLQRSQSPADDNGSRAR